MKILKILNLFKVKKNKKKAPKEITNPKLLKILEDRKKGTVKTYKYDTNKSLKENLEQWEKNKNEKDNN